MKLTVQHSVIIILFKLNYSDNNTSLNLIHPRSAIINIEII